MSNQCICGSRRPFANCCEPYLKGINGDHKLAPTAEALMRSRYTAFVVGNIDYLIATHHPDYRTDDPTGIQQTIQATQWVNLIVLGTHKGQRKDKVGSVEFVAAYRSKALVVPPVILSSTAKVSEEALEDSSDELSQLHERSQFVREGTQWFYTRGDLLPPYQPKRTQPCWCGSSLKFKQCHGSKQSLQQPLQRSV